MQRPSRSQPYGWVPPCSRSSPTQILIHSAYGLLATLLLVLMPPYSWSSCRPTHGPLDTLLMVFLPPCVWSSCHPTHGPLAALLMILLLPC
eukprot:1160231-Pelagomonas_calceolata.AAC.4